MLAFNFSEGTARHTAVEAGIMPRRNARFEAYTSLYRSDM